MQGGISQYLVEVLGLKWLVPKAQPKTEKRSNSLTIAVPRSPSAVETAMIHKMLSAISVKDFQLVIGAPSEFDVALTFGIGEVGSVQVRENGGKVLHSLDLGLLIEGHQDSISMYKRQAWEHLKQIKSWLQE